MMQKKLIYKILGIIGVILMITSVFLPFVNYYGYSLSLFDMAKNEFYVPYIILAFSVLTLFVFIIGKKVELSYLSMGASITLVVLYSVRYLDSFKYLSYGYYLLTLSPFVIFVAVLLYNQGQRKNDELKVVNNESLNNYSVNINNNEINNSIPNELAQSIMDQPVMKSSSDQVEDSITIEDEVKLSPQNPLNQFITPSINSNLNNVQQDIETVNTVSDNSQNKIVNLVSNEQKVNENIESEKQSDNSQSILSIMSQPMVGNSSFSSANSIDNNINSGVLLSSINNNTNINNNQNNIIQDSNLVSQGLSQQEGDTTMSIPVSNSVQEVVSNVQEIPTPVPVQELVANVQEVATPVPVQEVVPNVQEIPTLVPVQEVVANVQEVPTPVPVQEVVPNVQEVATPVPVQEVVPNVQEVATPVQEVVANVQEVATPVPVQEVVPNVQEISTPVPVQEVVPNVPVQSIENNQTTQVANEQTSDSNSVFNQNPIKFD